MDLRSSPCCSRPGSSLDLLAPPDVRAYSPRLSGASPWATNSATLRRLGAFLVLAVMVICIVALSNSRGDKQEVIPVYQLREADEVQSKGALRSQAGVEEAAKIGKVLGRPYMVFFGDSITEYSWDTKLHGWGAQLAKHYVRCADLINRGFSGYTTRDALKVVDAVFPLGDNSWMRPDPPSLVTVFFGANDAVLEDTWVNKDGTDHHVALHDYKANLKAIIAHLRRLSANMPIIIITPPPTNRAPARSNQEASKYARAAAEVVKELSDGTVLLNAFEALEGTNVDAFPSYLVDGLHLNTKGNTKIVEEIGGLIAESFPDLVPGGKAMPRQFSDPWD